MPPLRTSNDTEETVTGRGRRAIANLVQGVRDRLRGIARRNRQEDTDPF